MRRMVVVGLVGGAVVVSAVAWSRRRAAAPVVLGQPDWAPLTLTGPMPAATIEPVVAAVADTTDAGTPDAWTAALDDGACPLTHPVKASASGIYHLPGGRFYDTTHAKRCYRDAEAAEADGLRPSKR